MVSFNLLGKNTITIFLSQSYKDSIDKHNIKVQKNRKVLSVIIDRVLFVVCKRFHSEKVIKKNL